MRQASAQSTLADRATFETCPTAIARAHVERVWDLLTTPSLLGWVDGRLIEAPARRLREGDRLVFAEPLGLRVSWFVRVLEAPRQLALDIALPFGMANRETIVLTPLDPERCRISFG
jgi:hypothetical protein